MAHFNMELAIQYYEKLQQEKPELLKALSAKLDLTSAREAWNRLEQLYLPGPNEQGIIPQDDTYLQKKSSILTLIKIRPKSQASSMTTIWIRLVKCKFQSRLTS